MDEWDIKLVVLGEPMSQARPKFQSRDRNGKPLDFVRTRDPSECEAGLSGDGSGKGADKAIARAVAGGLLFLLCSLGRALQDGEICGDPQRVGAGVEGYGEGQG